MGAPRDLTSSDLFHISNKGVDGQDLFSLPGDQREFERRFADRLAAHGVVIHAFVWMTNHWHALVGLGDGSADLSAALRDVEGPYARAYNRRTQRSGPLHDRRFWSRPIVGPADFVAVICYVHRNLIVVVGAAHLADDPRSSLPFHLGRLPAPEWLETRLVAAEIDLDRHLAQVLTQSTADRFPVALDPPLRPATFEELRAAVDVVEDGAGERLPWRQLLMSIALELRVGSAVELAGASGVTPQWIRRTARRGRVAVVTDPCAAAARRAILAQLG